MLFHSDPLLWSPQTCFDIAFVSSGCCSAAHVSAYYIYLLLCHPAQPTCCARQWDGVNQLRKTLQKFPVCFLSMCVLSWTGSCIPPSHRPGGARSGAWCRCHGQFAGPGFPGKVWELAPGTHCCGDGSTAWLGLVRCLVGSGLWQGGASPCAGKIWRLRLDVAGSEITSVPKHRRLGSVSSTLLG